MLTRIIFLRQNNTTNGTGSLTRAWNKRQKETAKTFLPERAQVRKGVRAFSRTNLNYRVVTMSATFTDVAKNVRIDFFVNIGILLAAILGFYFVASFADVIIKYTTSRNQRKIERIRKRLAFAYTKSVASILVVRWKKCDGFD